MQIPINVPELRAELARRAWPMWKMAAMIGIGQTTLAGYLNGKTRPPPGLANRIEDALELKRGSLAPAQAPRAP